MHDIVFLSVKVGKKIEVFFHALNSAIMLTMVCLLVNTNFRSTKLASLDLVKWLWKFFQMKLVFIEFNKS